MKKIFTILNLTAISTLMAQSPAIEAWKLNTTGKKASYYETTGNPNNPTFTFVQSQIEADIQDVCYTNDSIWIKATGMTDNMGQFTNPGAPSNQDMIYRIPRNPSAATNNVSVPNVFSIGALINGISIFGKGDDKSYDPQQSDNVAMGPGVWNVDAWYSEGETLDTAFGAHPNQDGHYHSHATPFRLYNQVSPNQHSPIVGFSFDGYPIYGPYGYSDPNDANSSIKRIESGYALRSITTRTTLPDGSNSMPPGPTVSTQFPLGMYNEDYEHTSNTGDLDEHNGRFTVTPEYPNGIYAYFVTITSNGEPAYPYYIGTTYYGKVDEANLGPNNSITIPNSATCLSNTATSIDVEEVLDLAINLRK